MAKPDALRTDEDKSLEDKLITRLMAIVSQRNEIVDCLEMDRLRELEEDESIEIHFSEYAAIKPLGEEEILKKKKDKKKKEKKKKKKDKAYDADKDIDTSEFPSAGASLSNSPRPTPKKSPLAFNDKDKAKKLKKKLLSTLKPISMKRWWTIIAVKLDPIFRVEPEFWPEFWVLLGRVTWWRMHLKESFIFKIIPTGCIHY